MNKQIKILLIFFSFLLLTAKAQRPVHRVFNMKEGLPSYNVHCVLQDKNGFIWIGSQHGLSYFDGYKFHNFFKEDGLVNNNVLDIYEDNAGLIWVVSEGLNINYIKNYKIYEYKFNKEIKKKIFALHNYIKKSFDVNNNKISFAINKYGKYTVDTTGNVSKQEIQDLYNGFNVVRKNKDNYYVINSFYPNDTLIFDNIKYNVNQENNNSIHITQVRGTRIIASGKEINFYFKDKLIKSVSLQAKIIGLKPIKNLLWIFTNTKGVYIYKLCYITGEIKEVEHFFEGLRISDLLKDDENGYWLASYNHGIIYIPDLLHKDIYLKGIDNTSVITDLVLYKDILFVGYSNGLVEDVERNKTFQLFENQEDYFSEMKFAKDDKFLYILYNNEVFRYNGKALIKIITPQLLKRFDIFRLIDISANNTGNVVIAGENKVINIVNGEIQNVIDISSNIKESIKKIYISPANNLYISTYRGFYKYKIKNKRYFEYGIDSDLFSSGILDISSDELGNNIFVSTNGNGLIIITKSDSIIHYTKHNGLTGNIVTSVTYEDSTLFLGLNNGLNVFKISKDNKLYNKKTFNEDYDNVNKYSKKIIIYKNTLFQLSNTHLKQIYYKSDVTYEITPKIKLTHIKVLEKDTVFELVNPSLKYYENYLSFNFIGVSYKNAGNIDYRYRLLGSGTGWKYTKLRSVEYPFLPPGKYKFEVYASNKNGKWSKPASFEFEIRPPFWRQWWFIFTAFVLSIIAIIIIFILVTKSIKNKEKYKREIIKYRQQALRKQMNPHFIFNALNSIQHYILQNDKRMSSRYLSKFSSLIRVVLENSKNDLITLEQEIEAVKLYLEIEALRFKGKFEYHINIDENIDLISIKIPPLLFQPFIENAIWHGIMNLQDERIGMLTMTIKEEDNNIVCRIRDNGVGRKQAEKNKMKNKGKISLGNELINSRINLINSESNKKIYIKYIDLHDEYGKGKGTIVEIKINI